LWQANYANFHCMVYPLSEKIIPLWERSVEERLVKLFDCQRYHRSEAFGK
jgi:hypothetical protein